MKQSKGSILSAGDTDTQRAVTGALAGCYYGVENIPEEWLQKLMNREIIENMAKGLLEQSKADKA